MNQVCLLGRLTREPKVTHNGETAIAKYTLAVDRGRKQEGKQSADFISCVCFGKTAEFAERYLQKGTKIAVTGRIQTGDYTNKEGVKVYTTDVIVNSHYFCEKIGSEKMSEPKEEGFMPVDDFAGLPFN